ncbi:thioredoxin-like protein [Gongronella butleri]|nr:thioredoxin-like protein [Gongronella butleri]
MPMKDVHFLASHDDADKDAKKRRFACHDHDFDAVLANPVYQPRDAMVAPDFNCGAVVDPSLATVYALTNCLGAFRCQLSYVLQRTNAIVLFFYGQDGTPSCCSDLLSISANMERFEKFQALPLAMSIDDQDTHHAFLQHFTQEYQTSMPFPLLSDATRSITRNFNALNPDTGRANRAVFIIDKFRQVKFSFVVGDDRIVHSMDTIFTMLHMLLPAQTINAPRIF